MPIATPHTPWHRRRCTIAVGIALTVLTGGPVTPRSVDASSAVIEPVDRFTLPHVLHGETADVVVSVRGGANCSGTVISGGTMVATAAHCVLDPDGEVARSRTVVRDGVTYQATSVLVNPDYHDAPNPRLDAAVLVMAQQVAGPAATVGEAMPTTGRATLAGLQPLDTDGSMLRGTRYDNRPPPTGATGAVIHIESAVAGCTGPVTAVQITTTHVTVPCGLIRGASGGALLIEQAGLMQLVGIISTVAHDLTFNGVAPLATLHELLASPAAHSHDMDTSPTVHAAARVSRW